jgi:hypothetical protein
MLLALITIQEEDIRGLAMYFSKLQSLGGGILEIVLLLEQMNDKGGVL